ncbi:PREDICTED: interleukin-36 beta [Ceratotherium simum simum]|uniref:Interleukin-1 n=1 Tax=Ceratotherium simum simum TaxID=73337 RepID=A0ABM1D5H3_CERSS|nr:PREDICTED: interleukin-36 beta [Ceratotherium simum simum]
METPQFLHIRDSLQMVWVLKGNSLIAVPSSNNVKPVILALVSCTDQKLKKEEKDNLVYLGIRGMNLCLFCAEIQGQPTLQLKEKDIMDLYRMSEGQKPFLFFRILEGSTSAFQSLSYPDWFIATSSMAGQPITLSKERGKTDNTNFHLEV